jgi:hypothetical protein
LDHGHRFAKSGRADLCDFDHGTSGTIKHEAINDAASIFKTPQIIPVFPAAFDTVFAMTPR